MEIILCFFSFRLEKADKKPLRLVENTRSEIVSDG